MTEGDRKGRFRRRAGNMLAALLVAGTTACVHDKDARLTEWPDDYRDRHPIRVTYDAYGQAQVVPNECGVWPDHGTRTWKNRSYYNFGCASQNNLAAMIEDPRDLIAPRPIDPPYATRRQVVVEKYGKGEATGAAPPVEQPGSLSDVGN